jgi:hypothetical protein
MSRNSISLRAAFALAIAILEWPVILGAQVPATTIPTAKGTTLTGIPVVLPGSLKGKVGVLVVGFTRPSQAQVQAWGKRLAVDYAAASGVVYYEMPVLASAPSLARVTIEEEMKVSLPAAERAHFLPLTQNEAGWLAAAHYVQGDDAYVLLIGGDGVVRWQTQGPVTDANYAELKRKIAEMQAAMAAVAR